MRQPFAQQSDKISAGYNLGHERGNKSEAKRGQHRQFAAVLVPTGKDPLCRLADSILGAFGATAAGVQSCTDGCQAPLQAPVN